MREVVEHLATSGYDRRPAELGVGERPECLDHLLELGTIVGLEALRVIREEGLVEKSRELGAHMLKRLRAIRSPAVKEVRGRGLWAGVDINPAFAGAREACERLLAKGVLSKETHGTVVRLAPPLVIAKDDLDEALDRVEDVIHDLVRQPRHPLDTVAA